MKKPTVNQREMMQRMLDGAVLVRKNGRYTLNTWPVNYWTADGARHRGLIEYGGPDGYGGWLFRLSPAGRAALSAAADGREAKA